MRSVTSTIRFGFFLVLSSLLTLPAIAQSPEVVFLGTDPVTIGSAPVATADIGTLGVDAAGNQFYADVTNGTVVEVNTEGSQSAIVGRLKSPSIGVDYRGNVFVADTGNNRILESEAGEKRKTSVLTAASAPHAIAVDSADNVFYLSGTSLVELPNGGTPATVATVASGSEALAFGPALNGTRRLYILSLSRGTYNATLYSYPATGSGSYNATPLIGFLPAITGGTIQSFAVDPHNNAVIVNNDGSTAQVIIGRNGGGTASDFEQTIYTSQVPTTTITEDPNGSIYFLDSTGLQQIQLGAVNFGSLEFGGAVGLNDELTLNFGASPDVTYVASYPTGEFDAPDFDASPIYEQTPPIVALVLSPSDTGLLTGSLTLTDQNNRTLTILLYGTGLTAWTAYYTPAPDIRPHQTPSTSKPVAISPDGKYVLDAASSTFTYSGGVIKGLKNPRGLAVDGSGDVFITQIGVPGVLRGGADGTITQIATDITNPLAVAVDGPGNLYVTNGDDIVRVAPDGSESIFATPETDGGNRSALCLAVDYENNLYAGFAATGLNPNGGGIIKISPAGVVTGVASDVLQPGALAANHGPAALFFTDVKRGTVAVLDGMKGEKVLAFGFESPLGLATDTEGNVTVADSVLGHLITIGGGQSGVNINFGEVAVGSTSGYEISVVAVGSIPDMSGGELETPQQGFVCGGPPFNPNFSPNQPTGYGGPMISELKFTFTPTVPGTDSTQLVGYDNDAFVNHDGCNRGIAFNLTGTGVAVPGAAGFSLTTVPSPVFGEPLTFTVKALNPDLSLNTSFNGVVSIAYSVPTYAGNTPVSGMLTATLVKGIGSFTFTPPEAGLFTLTASSGSVSTTTDLTIGLVSAAIQASGNFVQGTTGPELSLSVTVKAQYTIPPGFIAITLDNAIGLGEFDLVNGRATFTSAPITNLSAGNHQVLIQYYGGNNFAYSSTTISIPYNPGP